LSLTGCIFNIVGIGMYFSRNPKIYVVSTFFNGIGALCTFIALLRNFYHHPTLNFVVRTFFVAVPTCINIFIGTFPFFLGFALSGTVWFGHYSLNFESTWDSILTLFAIMHGDVIRQIFYNLYGLHFGFKLLGRIYMYIYVMFFIGIILNMFYVILAEAYLSLGVTAIKTKMKLFDEDLEAEKIVVGKEDGTSTEDLIAKAKLEVNEILQRIIGKLKAKQNNELTRDQENSISLIAFYSSQYLA